MRLADYFLPMLARCAMAELVSHITKLQALTLGRWAWKISKLAELNAPNEPLLPNSPFPVHSHNEDSLPGYVAVVR